MTMNKSKAILLAFMLLVPTLFGIETAFAEIGDETKAKVKQEIQQFQLLTNCQPVYLLVESLNEDAKKIGLTKSLIFASA